MRIAIVGSRNCGNHRDRSDEIHLVLESHDYMCIVVSGGARGIDTLAREAAESTGCYYEEFLPDWKTYGKKAGFLRNQTIVDSCDELHAWWDGKSRGTAHSIELAKKAGKPVIIHRWNEP